jgi:acetyl-CoA/propionyl-CoA carboxylase biotin carboxyl carrier protein
VGQDGTISFLEVNTRLQVEHPVTEEVTGIDLVREMIRIADGAALGYDDPPVRGHAIEFRINGEDPGRNFLPTPGPVTVFRPPSGPGVRIDAGVEQGSVVGQSFDSLLAKLVVTGATRAQAVERSRRALAEFEVDGLATVIPFHRAVVHDAAFAPSDPDEPFAVHTRWIETEFDNRIEPYAGESQAPDVADRETVVVEVAGKRFEVSVPGGFRTYGDGTQGRRAGASKPPRRSGGGGGATVGGGDALASPMQGTIVKVVVEEGQQVAEGELVVVLEAMKMEQPINAHKAGTVTGLTAEVGATVANGAVLCEIKD